MIAAARAENCNNTRAQANDHVRDGECKLRRRMLSEKWQVRLRKLKWISTRKWLIKVKTIIARLGIYGMAGSIQMTMTEKTQN